MSNTIPGGCASLPFGGETYEAKVDRARLSRQATAVWRVMLDGEWHILQNIRQQIRSRFGLRSSEAGISARLRDFRKRAFGSHDVERTRIIFEEGLYTYRLTPNPDVQMELYELEAGDE